MDGENVEIAAGILDVPEMAPAVELLPTRPIPELGHILCQVCQRPTNSEVRNDLVDIPYAFYFEKEGIRSYRAVICFECYMGGVLAGAFAAHAAKQVEMGAGVSPGTFKVPAGTGPGEYDCSGPGELPSG